MPMHRPFRLHRLSIGCLTFLLSLGQAVAAETQDPPPDHATESCGAKPGVRALKHYPDVYNLYFENDLFAGTDNHYTNGVKLSWVSANLEDYVNDPCLPHWVRELNHYSEWLHPGAFDSRNMVVTFGQAMYTPTDPNRRDVIKDDRPYAGWLYLGLAYNARTERRMDTTEVDIGMVGPASLARQAQNFVHDLRGFQRFEGWGNQLHDELGLQFVRERKDRIYRHAERGGPQIDAITHYGYSLGNVRTYLNAGMEMRVGSFLPNDFGVSPIRPAGDSNAPLAEDASRRLGDSGIYGFVSLDGRAVAHDIFLDGNTFTDSHKVDKKYFVGDVAAGIAWQWPGGKITYAQYWRSKEFRTQQDAQSFGSVTLSLEY